MTVTWPNDRADAPIRMKFYAKTADLLRTEVCFDNREAGRLGAELGGHAMSDGAAADGSSLAGRLADLAMASVPMLDAMAAHSSRLDAPQRELLELMVALAPLMRSAARPPPGRPGLRPGARTRSQVRDALYHLLVMGRFDASELKTNGTVRKALQRIASEGGLLSEGTGRAALYTVDPAFSIARAAMRNALWPETVGDAPGTRRLAAGGAPN